MGNRFYQFLRPITNLVTTVVYRPKIYNKDLIPSQGGIIFAGNHLTDMDQLIVIKSTKRSIRFLTKKELYHGLLGKILEWYDTIPVDRDNKDENQAMRLSEEALNNGQAINIFPEGKEPFSEYHPDENIHALFAARSFNARMVTSVWVSGAINKAMIELDRQVKDIMGIEPKYLEDMYNE